MGEKKYNKTLGELEAEIMEIIWKLDQVSVRDVLSEINKRKSLAYTTVMTVMTRLCEKKMLKRKRLGNNAYLYAPARDKESYAASASKKIIGDMISNFGEDAAVAQFLDMLENGGMKKSEEWRRKLKTIIK